MDATIRSGVRRRAFLAARLPGCGEAALAFGDAVSGSMFHSISLAAPRLANRGRGFRRDLGMPHPDALDAAKQQTSNLFDDCADHYAMERERTPYFQAQLAIALPMLAGETGR